MSIDFQRPWFVPEPQPMFSGHGLEAWHGGTGPGRKIIERAVGMAGDDLVRMWARWAGGSTPQSLQVSIDRAAIARAGGDSRR